MLNKHASNPLSRYFWYESRLHVDHSLDGVDLQQINYYLNKGPIARFLCSHLKNTSTRRTPPYYGHRLAKKLIPALYACQEPFFSSQPTATTCIRWIRRFTEEEGRVMKETFPTYPVSRKSDEDLKNATVLMPRYFHSSRRGKSMTMFNRRNLRQPFVI